MWGLQMIDKLVNITPKTKVYYTMWLFNSSPWNIHPSLRTVNHLFLWAIYNMAKSFPAHLAHRHRIFPQLPGDDLLQRLRCLKTQAIAEMCFFSRIHFWPKCHPISEDIL